MPIEFRIFLLGRLSLSLIASTFFFCFKTSSFWLPILLHKYGRPEWIREFRPFQIQTCRKKKFICQIQISFLFSFWLWKTSLFRTFFLYISLFCSLFLCLTFSCSALTLSGNRKCFKLLDRLWGKQKRPQSDFLADCSNQADCSNFKTLGLFALNVLGQSLSGSFQNRSISLTSCLFGYSFPL